MCGRARCTLRADDIPRATHRGGQPSRTIDLDRYRPCYNCAPGRNLPVVRREENSDGDDYVLHCMKWGLIPSFTKKNEKPDHYKMFNARSESIYEKASFRRLIPKCRCLVTVEGFYEWKKDGSKKQPYYIHFKDGRPLVFAALYDSWKNSEGEIIYTFTILTTSSSPALQWLHDRMPIILGDKESTDTWLGRSSSSKFDTMLKPYGESDLIQLKKEDKNMISKFFMRKEIKKEEEEANGEEKSSHHDSVETDVHTSLKGEPKVEGCNEFSSSTDKSGDAKHLDDATGQGQVKRDYEEFSTDPDQRTCQTDATQTSPLKKKREVKSSEDKQPTLFDYFTKS
ncbi:abasic site processing protein HMCES isoform X2 [Rhodamnia argentea]|uniref:Abasic site processing protein HMCES isoform X2 n=1 Tax=Rhodamnia argentea TaxID=178133 RepID=A0ABM3HRE1_9MYRT|nr:abasic site processing protein HMCES isoform X2 [Rhodamnia argentea]